MCVCVGVWVWVCKKKGVRCVWKWVWCMCGCVKWKWCVWKWVLCMCRCVKERGALGSGCGEHLTVLYFSFLRYSGKFLIGGNFCTFWTHTKCAKITPKKIYVWYYGITWFFIVQQLFVYYGTPDVPVNMVAVYHHLGWWKKHAPWVERFELAQSVPPQGVWLEGPGKFENW